MIYSRYPRNCVDPEWSSLILNEVYGLIIFIDYEPAFTVQFDFIANRPALL